MKKIIFFVCILSIFGCKSITELSWEGAGDRVVTKRLFVKVESKKKLKQLSPSIANYIQDGMRVVVKVIDGELYSPGQKLALRIPNYLLENINVGAKIAVGLVSDTVFICVEKSSKASWKTACHTPLKLDIPIIK